MGMPISGEWEVILNTDAEVYAGSGVAVPEKVETFEEVTGFLYPCGI